MHREKMTPRRHVFSAIRRTLLAGGVLTLLVLALSSQDASNSVQQSLLLEVSAGSFIYGASPRPAERPPFVRGERPGESRADLDHRKIRRIAF